MNEKKQKNVNYICGVTLSQLAGFLKFHFGIKNFIKGKFNAKERCFTYYVNKSVLNDKKVTITTNQLKESIEKVYLCKIIPVNENDKQENE